MLTLKYWYRYDISIGLLMGIIQNFWVGASLVQSTNVCKIRTLYFNMDESDKQEFLKVLLAESLSLFRVIAQK